jgi:Zn-dependent peptidase ImmA (M78 family)
MPVMKTRSTEPRSVLASLRAVVPRRQLSYQETLRVAELQANRLLEHFEITTGAVHEEVITELPRIQVVREQIPESGAAHWSGRYWVITLNGGEPCVRQRFSLAHEFKHILDHTTKQYLYFDRALQTAEQQAERVADHFAACLLMPKKVVVGLWCSGQQDLFALAAKLHVSVPALRYRLAYLGLIDPSPRCKGRSDRIGAIEGAYSRRRAPGRRTPERITHRGVPRYER